LGQFSFLRLEGLKALHKLLLELNEEGVLIFCSLQDGNTYNGTFFY